MFVRVVRFTDVTRERMDQLTSRINESEGPPPGIPAVAIQVMFDEEQGTAVVSQSFDSAEDMQSAEEAFNSMDPGDTPGTRSSVDRCELKVERQAGG